MRARFRALVPGGSATSLLLSSPRRSALTIKTCGLKVKEAELPLGKPKASRVSHNSYSRLSGNRRHPRAYRKRLWRSGLQF